MVVEDMNLNSMTFKDMTNELENLYQSIPREWRDTAEHTFYGEDEDIVLDVHYTRQITDEELQKRFEEQKTKRIELEANEKGAEIKQLLKLMRKHPKTTILHAAEIRM